MPPTRAAPRVSLIMPAYNGVRHLAASLDAFLAQDLREKQLVTVGSKSTDGTNELLESYAARHTEIVWLAVADAGIADAVNTGLEEATGDLIGYLGTDDILLPGILSTASQIAERIDCDGIYFDSYTYRVADQSCVLRRCPDLEFTRQNLLKFGTIVGLQDILFRRALFEAHRFDQANAYSFDYQFYLEITRHPRVMVHVPQPATVNIFDGNITGTLAGAQAAEALRVARRNCESLVERAHVERRAFREWRARRFGRGAPEVAVTND